MFKKYWYVLIPSLLLILGAVAVIVFKGPNKSHAVEVDWRLLGELDYISGKFDGELKKVNKGYVRIPGFVVPLEDDQRKITEFLLVPTPQACIHVPPPPPNQMVYVKMKSGAEYEMPFGPVWVYGVLNIDTQKTMYGNVSYQLEGELIEPYE